MIPVKGEPSRSPSKGRSKIRIPDIPVRTVPELCREYGVQVSAKVLARLIQVFDPKKGKGHYTNNKGKEWTDFGIQVITTIMLNEGIDISRITEIFESIEISSTANPKTPSNHSDEEQSDGEQSSEGHRKALA